MANIVAATIELLKTKGPQDITLREIANESGHHHRMIVEWFGGKGGLFNAVAVEVFAKLIESGEIFTLDVALRDEVRLVFDIFNYMQMHHTEIVKQFQSGFVVNTIEQRLVDFQGWDRAEASFLAKRFAVQTIGLVLFREFFGISDEEAQRIIAEEFVRVSRLHPPGGN